MTKRTLWIWCGMLMSVLIFPHCQCFNLDDVEPYARPCVVDSDCLHEAYQCVSGYCQGKTATQKCFESTCNDGVFCNGEETCTDDICISGQSPCSEGERCNEQAHTCEIIVQPCRNPQIDCPTARECEEWLCNAQNECVSNPVSSQTPCSLGVCNGTGQCVQCNLDIECGTNTDCSTYACTPTGMCERLDADMNDACNENNGNVCNHSGDCVQCNDNAHCLPSTECKLAVCDMVTNSCIESDVINGEPCGLNDSLSCVEGICTGCSNDTECRDVNNSCDISTCNLTSQVCENQSRPLNSACLMALGGDGFCSSEGACVSCNEHSQCSDGSDCQDAVCNNHQCGQESVPNGESCGVGGMQQCVDGTCVCINNEDCSAEECYEPHCSSGTCDSTPSVMRTVCNDGNTGNGVSDVCDGEGSCVDCLNNSDCETPTTCHEIQCTINHTCQESLATDGTPCTQSGGVDGFCVSGICQSCAQPSDCGVDTQCATPSCDVINGTCIPGYVTPGTSCNDGIATNGTTDVCNGNGNCVDCVTQTQCPADTLCRDYSCGAGGNCIFVNQPSGENCGIDLECDGNGNCMGVCGPSNCVDNSATDCLATTCNADTCETNNIVSGTNCSVPGGITNGLCDGNGSCVECINASNCSASTDCETASCVSNTCTTADKPLNTQCDYPGGAPNDGVCDGIGNCAQCTSAGQCPDPGDCVAPACSANACTTSNESINTPCLGGANVCDGAGSCVQCNNATQCNDPGDCFDPVCVGNTCNADPVATNTLCFDGNPIWSGNDVCNGSTGCVDCIANPGAECADPGECKVATCVASSCAVTNASDGTPCLTGVCNAGSCVTCYDGVSNPDPGCTVAYEICIAGATCETCRDNQASFIIPDEGCSTVLPMCIDSNSPYTCVKCQQEDTNFDGFDDGCSVVTPACVSPNVTTGCKECNVDYPCPDDLNECTVESCDATNTCRVDTTMNNGIACNGGSGVCDNGNCVVCVEDATSPNNDTGCFDPQEVCVAGISCEECDDTASGSNADEGCNDNPLNKLCFMSSSPTCVRCLQQDENGDGRDDGCPVSDPVCVDNFNCGDCDDNMDCDDGNSCTLNSCNIGTGTCATVFVNEGDACIDEPGICNAAGMCVECIDVSDCSPLIVDGDCTEYTCNASYMCEGVNVPNGQACYPPGSSISGVCSTGLCNVCRDTVEPAGTSNPDQGCNAATPACLNGLGEGGGECFRCQDTTTGFGNVDDGCAADAFKQCNSGESACVECTEDDDCDVSSSDTKCLVSSNTCVECLSDLDCSGIDVCDVSTNTCVQCIDDQVGNVVDHGCASPQPNCDDSGPVAVCIGCNIDFICFTNGNNYCEDFACQTTGFCELEEKPTGTTPCEDDDGLGDYCEGTLDPNNISCVMCTEDAHCSGNDRCQINPMNPLFGECVECLSNSDCEDGNPCTIDVCNLGSFSCSVTFANESMSCDDGNSDNGTTDICEIDTSGNGTGVCVGCVDNNPTGVDVGCDATDPFCDDIIFPGMCGDCSSHSDCDLNNDGQICYSLSLGNQCGCMDDVFHSDCLLGNRPICDPAPAGCRACSFDNECTAKDNDGMPGGPCFTTCNIGTGFCEGSGGCIL
jgi:hypothetical protein